MINLAGVKDCDATISEELRLARIPALNAISVSRDEVPWKVYGQLGPFQFYRAWYYYIVSGGLVPLKIAEEMYADPLGQKDVRCAGDCACRPPKQWCDYFYDGKQCCSLKEQAGFDRYIKKGLFKEQDIYSKYHFCENPEELGEGVIASYHIDSLAGLRFFADSITKAGLI